MRIFRRRNGVVGGKGTLGHFELVKKRVTTKDVPPDIAAAKIILDDGGIDELTDEQLEAEKRRLLEILQTSSDVSNTQ